MPAIPGLHVFRSPIHGYGIVATRDYQGGEILTDIDGAVFGEEELVDDRFALWLEGTWYLDMLDQTRWINHSCQPNVWIDGALRRDGTGWAHLISLRFIRAGEEITYDYALPADLAEPCRCGATKCRGWIVDDGDLDRIRARAGVARASHGRNRPPVMR